MASTIQHLYEDTFQGDRNMSFGERAASTVFGLAMAAGGLNRGGLSGALMGVAGAALVARGLNGHCPVKAMMQEKGYGPLAHHEAGHQPSRYQDDRAESDPGYDDYVRGNASPRTLEPSDAPRYGGSF
jgi:hypothetical protein